MTRKYVLTGGPGSGKSSIILALEDCWQHVIREAAEDVIKLMKAEGVTEPWNQANFQDRILQLQRKREFHARLTDASRIFIDRGTLDGLAYYQIQGREPSHMMQEELKWYDLAARGMLGVNKRYDGVFLIENLGNCEKNRVRREDFEQSLELERLQGENYRKAGYEVIRIAPGTIEERMKRILCLLNQPGGKNGK